LLSRDSRPHSIASRTFCGSSASWEPSGSATPGWKAPLASAATELVCASAWTGRAGVASGGGGGGSGEAISSEVPRAAGHFTAGPAGITGVQSEPAVRAVLRRAVDTRFKGFGGCLEGFKSHPRCVLSGSRRPPPQLPVALLSLAAWDAFLAAPVHRQVPAGVHLPAAELPQPAAALRARAVPLNDLFTEAEVRDALAQLQNGRSPGISGLPTEFLRYAVTAPP
jgi:hypothetical protein